jgi:hypothetical protein
LNWPCPLPINSQRNVSLEKRTGGASSQGVIAWTSARFSFAEIWPDLLPEMDAGPFVLR